MKCPYCISEIDDAALACPHCAHDLYLFKPLLAQIQTLEDELAQTKERIGALEAQARAGVPQDVAASAENLAEQAMDVEQNSIPANRSVLWLWLVPLLLLIASHYLIVVVLDVNMLWLHILSLLIPLPFGFLLMSRQFRSFPQSLLLAVGVASAAVLAMSSVVHFVDGTPILPQGTTDWRELIEYATSICFSFASGMVIGRRDWHLYQNVLVNNLMMRKLINLMTRHNEDLRKLGDLSWKINNISRSITAVGTVSSALYTGLHGFF